MTILNSKVTILLYDYYKKNTLHKIVVPFCNRPTVFMYIPTFSECKEGWTYYPHTKNCYKYFTTLTYPSAANDYCKTLSEEVMM